MGAIAKQASWFATLVGASALLVGAACAEDMPHSPLFGAEPFTQQMLLFEEFGTRATPKAACTNCKPLPIPKDCFTSPASLDAFLKQRLDALPTREANTTKENQWAAKIFTCLGALRTSVQEGRPAGEFFAHQRWDEYKPEVYFTSVQAGARANGGARDGFQRHQYAMGEFGPGGLYHNVAGAPGFDGTTKGLQIRLHPKMPVQDQNSVWTFDGTLPPKLLVSRLGEPVLFRHFNGLPINPAANKGFGAHTITTHAHNGHNPGESDGFANAYFFPGQYYDYVWPMTLGGRDSVNTDSKAPRSAYPTGSGKNKRIPGDWRETPSTHWFHDHMLDFTAQNVYKGNAAMMNIYSSVDRGNEAVDCHYKNPNSVNFCFPSGTALDWGNRDYDVNLLLADKAWDRLGQLQFDIFNLDGFIGDQMTVNWLWKPHFNVRARRYRFRILNGSVSRYFRTAIVTEQGERVPFHMIANDGNIMEHAIPFPNAQSQDLPTQAIAERYDIIVDFSRYAPGTKIYFVNTMEHEDGRGPSGVATLAKAMAGQSLDPAVGKFLEIRVQPYSGKDLSMNPVDYEPGKKQMIPLPGFTAQELANARRRHFEFGRSDGTDEFPWTIKTDGGEGLPADMHRVSAAPEVGSVEIWTLRNGGNGWSHPVHIHFEEGQVLNRDGHAVPLWERYARKDVYRIGPEVDSSREIQVALRFREFGGTYVEHCHNTQHEDHAMLLRWDLEKPGQLTRIPTPVPTWEGVGYEPTFVLPTFKTGQVQ